MRFRFISISALVVALAAIVAGCGGGGSVPSGSTIGSTPQPQPSSGAAATLHVTVAVGGSGTAKVVRPGYVSSNTQSVAIQLVSSNGSPVSGQTAAVVQTYAGAPGCTGTGSTLTCAQDVKTISGQDVFAVTLFSAPNATGTALASGFITSNVSAGGGSLPITNSTSLALSGIVANISVSTAPMSLTYGVPGSVQVILNATDASGATIIAPGTFSSPIELTTNDGTGSFGFTTSTTTTPSSSLSVTSPGAAIRLVYNGSTSAFGPVVITAALGSLQATAQLQLTIPVTPTPSGSPSPAPSGLIYVLNAGSGNGLGSGASVTEYQTNASGNTAPVRTLNLNNPATANLYAAGMTVDSAGNLFIGYYDTAPVFDTYQAYGGNEIAMYASGASGSAAPSSTLLSVSDPNQNQAYLDPGLIVVDSQGRLNTLGDDGAMGYSVILTYPKAATGATQPSNAFAFSSAYPLLGAFSYYGGSTNGYTSGFTEDAAGNLYVAGSFYFNGNDVGSLEIAPSNFVSDPSQLSTPSRYFIANAITKLANDNLENGISSPHDIQGLALDASGAIYESQIAGSARAASINVYSAGAGGGKTNNPPIRTITSTAFPSVDPSTEVGIMPISILGSSLYAVNRPANSILVFPTNASGASSPSATISGSATKLQSPMAIVVSNAGTGHAAPRRELHRR